MVQPVNPAAEPSLPPKPGMNLHEIMKDYVESMLSEQPGRKALILDRQTLGKSTKAEVKTSTLNSSNSRITSLFPSHCFHDIFEDSDPPERSLLHRRN